MIRGRQFRTVATLTALALCAAPSTARAASTVTVTASPTSLTAPGGTFNFTVSVTTADPPGSVGGLTDDRYGNLQNKGTCDFALPKVLPYSCTYSGSFTGAAGQTQTNTVTGFGFDNAPGGAWSAFGSATISLTPPPLPIVAQTGQRAAALKKCAKKKTKAKRKKCRKKAALLPV